MDGICMMGWEGRMDLVIVNYDRSRDKSHATVHRLA